MKLIDFGLAFLGDPSLIAKNTIMAGTPVYLPPEVLREQRVTNKLDVYSFGVILWELIARQLPFEGLSFTQMVCRLALALCSVVRALRCEVDGASGGRGACTQRCNDSLPAPTACCELPGPGQESREFGRGRLGEE